MLKPEPVVYIYLFSGKYPFLRRILLLLKMIISSVASTISVWLLLRGLDLYVFDTTRISGLIGLTSISSFGGILVYLSLGLAFQLQEARAIVKLAKSVLVWPRDILPIHELPPQVE